MSEDYKKQLKFLKKLQSIDFKLHHLELERTEIPEQIDIAKAILDEISEKYYVTKSKFDVTSKESKALEDELSHWKNQAKKREAKLYTIANNREYQAITREISEIKRSNRDREEKILALMEQLEILEPDTRRLEDEVREAEANVKKANEGTVERLKEIELEVNEIAKDRPQVLEQLEKKLVRRYDFMRSRSPDALIAVKDGTCGGCHTRIIPQLYNEMLKFDEFKECPMCRRILYIEQEKDENQPEEQLKINS